MAAFDLETATVLLNDLIYFSNASSLADQYLWDLGDGTTSTKVSPYHMYDMPGEFTVSLIASNGLCEDVHSTTITVELSTGIHQSFDRNGNVWTDGNFFLIDHSMNDGVVQVTIMDAAGRMHMRQQFAAATGRISIPAAGLGNGIWMIQLEHNSDRSNFRIPLMR
ncbi:MAG: PKD domain-containing protein [Bacteroidota bacterium]|nr:PKD domain-containing protein [Bacteroidota bacterium]